MHGFGALELRLAECVRTIPTLHGLPLLGLAHFPHCLQHIDGIIQPPPDVLVLPAVRHHFRQLVIGNCLTGLEVAEEG